MVFYALTTTYGAVLASELIGDRSMYAVAGLSARFGPRAVMAGVLPAFMLKSLAAVLLGAAVLSRLPRDVIAVLSAATFCVAAVHLWRAKETAELAARSHTIQMRGILAAFAAIFFSEWADVGQFTT